MGKSFDLVDTSFPHYGDNGTQLNRLKTFTEPPPSYEESQPDNYQPRAREFTSQKSGEHLDVDDEDTSGDENTERGNWSGQLDFILSCLGYAVGLGNVWRFPYKCYENGGGAFLIPYVIMLMFVGMPIFFMELTIGQFSSCGPLTCFRLCPMLSGMGWGMVIVSAVVAIYYNMIIGWSLYYLFKSFTKKLPWETCDNDWNTDYCHHNIPDTYCNETWMTGNDTTGLCLNGTKPIGVWNNSLFQASGLQRESASEQYFNNEILKLSDGIEDIGTIQWQLAVVLFIAWVIVFLCLCNGVKSSGKVVYFTALFPYVVLVILFFRGVLLEGAGTGIEFYMKPTWDKLGSAKVWHDAASQIFFSLSACWGGLITLSSYNRFHNNHLRDTFIVTLGNCLTSIFAGFVIFSYLGHMAHQLDVSVDNVVASGTGLAFIVYPEAVTHMPVSPLWAILFFLMLITLGLDSQFTLLETVSTSLMDRWPAMFTRTRKTLWILAVSVTFYAIGLLLCTNGGMYVLELMDTYAGGWAILVIGLTECSAVMYCYGWQRFSNDIHVMTGRHAWFWWRINWTVITPVIVLAVLIFSWVDYSGLTYGTYEYPTWANAIGWVIAICVAIPIPIVMCITFFRAKGSFLERLRTITRATNDYGPALVKYRRLVAKYAPEKYFDIDPKAPKKRDGKDNQAFNYDGSDMQHEIDGKDNQVMSYNENYM